MKSKNGFIGFERKDVVAFNEIKFQGSAKIFNQKVENSNEKLEIEEDLKGLIQISIHKDIVPFLYLGSTIHPFGDSLKFYTHH